MVIKILTSLILFFQLSNISFACSFNCGGTFEEGNTYGLKTTSHSGYKRHVFGQMPKKDFFHKYIKDSSNSRAGKAYQRFELRAGDCFYFKGSWNDCKTDRERFEFSSRPEQKPIGKQCYGYSIKLDKSFKDVWPTSTDLGQIKQEGGPKGKAGGFESFPPLIQIRAEQNKLFFAWHVLTGDKNNIRNDIKLKTLAEIHKIRGKWTDISFCLDYKNKRMDAWVNGEKKVEILKSPITSTVEPKSTYFKYGIYRSFVSQYKVLHGKIPTQIVYYDEVRRGTKIEDVDRNINPKLKPVD